MKQVENERGITGILLPLFVVLVIVLAGVALYTAHQSAKQKEASVTTTSPTPASTSVPAASSATPVPTAYLDIKELGVKIKLTDDLKDAMYVYSPSVQKATISTQSLIAASSTCRPTNSGGPLGAILKTQDPHVQGTTLAVDNQTVFKFGSDYIYYVTPDTSCSGPTSTQLQLLNSFKQAFKTITID